jgi:hypothetical protein
MSEIMDKIALEAVSMFSYDSEGNKYMSETEYKRFAELVVKQTINEMIGQMWHHGVDESNNPSFYKAIDKTKEHFGIKE